MGCGSSLGKPAKHKDGNASAAFSEPDTSADEQTVPEIEELKQIKALRLPDRCTEQPASCPRFPEPESPRAVADFHRYYGLPIGTTPKLPSRARMDLQLNLIDEEVKELKAAMDAGDLVESADALADIQYVLCGAVHELGMGSCFAQLFKEVQRSNMSKACSSLELAERTVTHYQENKGAEARIDEKEVDGTVVYIVKRSDGKQLKSIEFSPPDLAPILKAAQNSTDEASGEEAAAVPQAEFRRPSAINGVAAFHRYFGLPVSNTPKLPSRERMDLLLNLILEEVEELRTAMAEDDLVECADALADIQYVLCGAVHEIGLGGCFAELFDEVQRSNMSKACKTMENAEETVVHYRENKGMEARIEEKDLDGEVVYLIKRSNDGKQLKSVTFSPPDLIPILARAGADSQDLLPLVIDAPGP